jgi:alpha-galactosidase
VSPWSNYDTRSHLFGGPLIVMDQITEWPDFMAEFMREEIGIYKALRKQIVEGKVYHLTPVPDGTFNDYIQSHHPATDRSVILIYRQESLSDWELVRPAGHQPEKVYRVRFQESLRTYTVSGRELMENGIWVELPEPFFAEIAYIELLGE